MLFNKVILNFAGLVIMLSGSNEKCVFRLPDIGIQTYLLYIYICLKLLLQIPGSFGLNENVEVNFLGQLQAGWSWTRQLAEHDIER